MVLHFLWSLVSVWSDAAETAVFASGLVEMNIRSGQAPACRPVLRILHFTCHPAPRTSPAASTCLRRPSSGFICFKDRLESSLDGAFVPCFPCTRGCTSHPACILYWYCKACKVFFVDCLMAHDISASLSALTSFHSVLVLHPDLSIEACMRRLATTQCEGSARHDVGESLA